MLGDEIVDLRLPSFSSSSNVGAMGGANINPSASAENLSWVGVVAKTIPSPLEMQRSQGDSVGKVGS